MNMTFYERLIFKQSNRKTFVEKMQQGLRIFYLSSVTSNNFYCQGVKRQA